MESLLEGISHTGAKTTVEEKLQNLEKTIYKLEEEAQDDARDQAEKKPIIIVWYNRPVFRAIAASVIILVVAVYAFGPFGTVPDDKLFTEYFKPQDNLMTTRGDENRREAYAAYDLKNYDLAASLLQKDLLTSDNKITDKFYLGNCFLALDQGDNALKYFKEVVEINEGFAPEAKWYLALTYLRIGERENARKEFEEMVEAESDYAEEAKEILGKMRKNKDVLMNLIQFSN
jgi:tetratricopeptide (TPR) repeat protein